MLIISLSTNLTITYFINYNANVIVISCSQPVPAVPNRTCAESQEPICFPGRSLHRPNHLRGSSSQAQKKGQNNVPALSKLFED